ncbi:MAG: hypothetical protein M1833_006198 [Piccolia ochrophora]|nr:MAG: hypothetical protein M1833_006198 [Piccolia ochrophora]
MHSVLRLVLTVLAIASVVVATNNKDDDGRHSRHRCLTDREARKITDRWIRLNVYELDLLDRTVTDDFSVEDETISFFFPCDFPPTGPYVTSKAALLTTLENRPPGVTTFGYDVLIIFHDCNSIAFRWQHNGETDGKDPTSSQKAGSPVIYKGIDILQVKKGTNLVQSVYSSADWFRSTYAAGSKICFQKDAPPGPLCADSAPPTCPAPAPA